MQTDDKRHSAYFIILCNEGLFVRAAVIGLTTAAPDRAEVADQLKANMTGDKDDSRKLQY